MIDNLLVQFLLASASVAYVFLDIYFVHEWLKHGKFKKTAIAMTFLWMVVLVMSGGHR